jgi:hypothetical protein
MNFSLPYFRLFENGVAFFAHPSEASGGELRCEDAEQSRTIFFLIPKSWNPCTGFAW